MNRRIPNGTYGGVRGRGPAECTLAIEVPSWKKISWVPMRVAVKKFATDVRISTRLGQNSFKLAEYDSFDLLQDVNIITNPK